MTFYDLELSNARASDIDLVHDTIANVVHRPEGRLPGLDLVLLTGHANAFPLSYAAPVVDQELLVENLELEGIPNSPGGQTDQETIAELNAQVDELGIERADIARACRAEKATISPEGYRSSLRVHAREHGTNASLVGCRLDVCGILEGHETVRPRSRGTQEGESPHGTIHQNVCGGARCTGAGACVACRCGRCRSSG